MSVIADRDVVAALLEQIGVDKYDPALDGDDNRHQSQHEWHQTVAAPPADAPAGLVRRQAFALSAHPRGLPGKPAMRRDLQSLALYFYGLRTRIDYSQARPIYGVRPFIPPKKLGRNPYWRWDCSGSVTYLYRAATGGQVDPNGNGFSGGGYTGTLIAHGTKVKVPRIGDLAFYNDSWGWHVTLFIEAGLDGRVFSMGSPPGPLILPNDYRTVIAIRRYI